MDNAATVTNPPVEFVAVKPEVEPVETSSMCPRCEDENGITKLLLITIPYFREVILASFECTQDDCGYKNATVQFGGTCEPKGCVYSLKVQTIKDLNRQLVRSEYCSVALPEIEFEIPSKGEGEVTTVEGLLASAVEGIQEAQKLREESHPEVARQLQQFLTNKLQPCLEVKSEFTLQIKDPSGNSFIATLNPPHPDPQLTITHFVRSKEDDVSLGLATEDEENGVQSHNDNAECSDHSGTTTNITSSKSPSKDNKGVNVDLPAEAPAVDYNTRRTEQEEKKLEEGELLSLGYELQELCYACKRTGNMKMAMVDIPHFKETVIMSFKCDYCGFKSNEIKCGGAIPPCGTRFTLLMKREEDLSRDILKSHTCSVRIPELDFEMSEGSLGAMFTTVEGLLTQIHQQLLNVHNGGFSLGDSSTTQERSEFSKVLHILDMMKSGKQFPFTIILEDPLSHSYLQSLADENEPDPQLLVEKFERTEEQNEELGIDFLMEQERKDEEERQKSQQQQLPTS